MISNVYILSNIFTYQPLDALFLETITEGMSPLFIIVLLVLIITLSVIAALLFRSRFILKRQLGEQQLNLESCRSRLDKVESLANIDSAEREFETINRLVAAIEHRDIETANHIVRMAHYSRLIAKNLFEPDSAMVGLIFLAAPMHDVGKIGISDKILGKPHRLDHFEYTEMKRHTLIGHDILKGSSSPVIQLGAVIALTHHEHYDGSGYPRGLKEQEIPVAGRIVAVADHFDALVSHRVYKKAWPLERAVQEIRNASGKRFDPLCVEAFLNCLDEILKVREQYLDEMKNGEQRTLNGGYEE